MGVETEITPWHRGIGAEPQWVPIPLRRVDRIEIIAKAQSLGIGFYGMDNLTYLLEPPLGIFDFASTPISIVIEP